MRSRSFIAVVLGLLALLVGAVGVYAVDSTSDGRIAEGVRVGNVAVGGLLRDEALALVRRELLDPLEAPLVVRAGHRRFRLSAREANIRANVGAMVDEALRRSRDGNVVSRTWRSLTGGELDVNVRPQVRYSRAAVDRLIARVRRKAGRPAVDAKVDFSATEVEVRRSRTGRTIDADALRRKVADALESGGRTRVVRARLRKTRPRITTAELAGKHPTIITIDRGAYRLRLFKKLKLVKTYPIAVGQAGLETPAGLYDIQNKAVNPAWNVPNSAWAGSLAGTVVPPGPSNPLKARWLGIYNGAGIHGTAERGSIGTNASHGCIRMLVEDVIDLYDRVEVGAPVYIV